MGRKGAEMSELRWHPFLEQWVITATHRQDRTFLPPADYCPLCPTRPGGFPTEVPDPTYDIVVFENKFPSLQANPPEPAVAATPLSPVEPAKGVCEVVVYSPRHEDALASMPLERIHHLARVWKDRYLELGARDFVRYVFIFENRGEAVGVTLHHPHGQIYAFPFIPALIEKELAASRRYHAEKGKCLMCASLAEEIRDGRRIVLEGDRFLAWVPFHARWPYEVTLASRGHQVSMAEWSAADMEDLAAVLKGLLQKYDALFAKPFPYMMVIHQAPTDGEDHRHAHLHFEFYTPQRAPDRLKFLAGVESGAGNYINDKLAEESAAELRRVGPASVAAVRAADEADREHAPSAQPFVRGQRPAHSMSDVLEAAFGPGEKAVTAFAPGRVNLIGEHTDYNEGFVLPMAIEDGIEMAARSRAGREVRVHSFDLGETVAFSLEEPIRPDPVHPWSNYVRGVLWALGRAGVALGGMDLAFGGTLPQGAGLSSSAALQVATALVTRALLRFPMDVPRLARICQESENELVGVKVGIMDPFVSLAARKGHALFLDCRTLAFEQVPLALGEHVVAICYSGVKHALVASEYNLRRRQCAAGVEVLRALDPRIRALRDASLEALDACRAELDPVVYRRCRHVVTENARVLESKSALGKGDLRRFGESMDASHASLRDDYEVSCAEIDLLVDLARQSSGVLGARITGGGFGGCTVNLVARGAVESFRKEVLGEYRRRTGIDGWVFVSEAADGANLAGQIR